MLIKRTVPSLEHTPWQPLLDDVQDGLNRLSHCWPWDLLYAPVVADLAAKVHLINCKIGWWSAGNRNLGELLMLTVSEISEGYAAQGEMDAHLPDYPADAVELADVVIRLLDTIGAYDLATVTTLTEGEWRRLVLFQRWDDYALRTIAELVAALEAHRRGHDGLVGQPLVHAVAMSLWFGLDARLPEIILAKLTYNTTRADHRQEIRALAGGKRY